MNSLPAKLDLTGAEICGELDEQNPPIHLPNQASDAPLLALDIGGTLIKIVYFKESKEEDKNASRAVGGKLRFVKFERRRLDECLEFIQSKKLIYRNGATGSNTGHVAIKATGGGAYKFADVFKDKLGIYLDKLDEMESVVAGANFLLQRIKDAAFTHLNGRRNPIDIKSKNLFPYLLVNIGSGVSIIKVTGNRQFERVTGTQIGGGTMFGLAKLLTGSTSYNEFLKLSQKGDNVVLDLIVRDICGELVCQKQGLSASTLASSFGKVITSKKTLADFKKEDLAAALLSAFTYNIAQISFLVASLLGLSRVFFGGSYVRGHTSTMNNIAYAIDFWSKGQMQAVFLHHEGFLGALGALTSYETLESNNFTSSEEPAEQVQSHENSVPFDGKLAAENGDHNIFPYLLVNIGSGVSMIEVIGKGKFERIIGSHLGGGTILGLARLLTGVSSYEQLLELSQGGNNLSVDLTVGDIYGEHGYPKIGLPATTTASSFGKVNSNKLSEYRPQDLAAALLNLFTYNVGQIAYFVANLSGLKRIFFRGAYVCGHEKTMEKISKSLKYWSKDQVQTTFLCHEGFLGTLGAFWSYENMGIDGLAEHEVIREVLLGAPYTGGQFPSVPPTEQCNSDNDADLKLEADKLRKENALLREEVERLRRQNDELTVRLTSQCNGNSKLH